MLGGEILDPSRHRSKPAFLAFSISFQQSGKLQKNKTGIDVVLHAVSNPLQRSTKIKASGC
jgi:hypothetical protein